MNTTKYIFLIFLMSLILSEESQAQFIVNPDYFILGHNSIPDGFLSVRPMIFYSNLANRAAFRAGYYADDAWAEAKLGVGSIAGGMGTEAITAGSAAFGNTVSGEHMNSFSMGLNLDATGQNSWNTGRDNTVTSMNSLVHGKDLTVGGEFASHNNFIFGENLIVTGSNAFAFGQSSTVSSNSVLIGRNSTMGQAVDFSTGLGFALEVNNDEQFIVGKYNSDGSNGPSNPNLRFVVGNGNLTAGIRSNALVISRFDRMGIGTDYPCEALQVMGDISIGSEIINSSDKRLKKKIRKMGDVSKKIRQIRPVYYHYKTSEFRDYNFSSERQVGVIAQEIETLFPELVTYDADGMKHVDYVRLSVILLRGIQETHSKNIEMKRQLSLLQEAFHQLEKI